MLDQLPPRFFCDFTLPQRKDGSDLSSRREPGDYEFEKKRDPFDVILNDDVIPIRKRIAAIPKALASAIDRAVTKNHKDRFLDASVLLSALKKMS